MGYLHRCFEKMAETHPYNQVIPYTDRRQLLLGPDEQHRLLQSGRKTDGHRDSPEAVAIRVILADSRA